LLKISILFHFLLAQALEAMAIEVVIEIIEDHIGDGAMVGEVVRGDIETHTRILDLTSVLDQGIKIVI